MDIFDLIIIGGGPAGYSAAELAGHAGLKVLLAEKKALGGVCLNEGCVPSKTLLNSAKIYDYALHGEKYGVTVKGAAINQAAVIDRKNKVVDTLVSGVGMKLKKNRVTVVYGNANILSKDKDEFVIEIDKNEYRSKKLLLCTGSQTFIPPIKGLTEVDNGFIVTNRGILDLKEIPKNLVVIGGGVIGLEMAAYYNSVGSKVTVIEMLNSIGGMLDGEIAGILLKNYTDKGVEFKLSCKVTAVGKDYVECEEKGKKNKIAADCVLLSAGRKPVTTGFGLENLNPVMNGNAIKTDEYGKTSIPGLYAAGDVNGKSMLAHTAYREAQVVINNILGKRDIMRYNAIPSVIYTNPEVACVGETADTAKEKGFDVEVKTISMMYSGRYVAETEAKDGICKLIIDKKTSSLIGVHMIGSYCSEIIYGAALMIEAQLRTDDIKELVFPHPTVSEIIKEALYI